MNLELKEKVERCGGVNNITAVRIQSKDSIDYFAVARNEITMRAVVAIILEKGNLKSYANFLKYVVDKGVKFDQNDENLTLLKYPKHLFLNFGGSLKEICKYTV